MSKETRINKLKKILESNGIKHNSRIVFNDSIHTSCKQIDDFYLDLIRSKIKKGTSY